MRCPVCSEPIQNGQTVQRIPVPEMVMQGAKSGQLGCYAHSGFQGQTEDIVHYPECCMGFFSPDDNPYIYDQVTETLREELRRELLSEMREEFKDKFQRVQQLAGEGRVCTECWDELEGEEENPMCIFCKRPETVWQQTAWNGGKVFFCSACQKYWDQDEQELTAA